MKARLLKLVAVVLFLAVAGIFSVSNAQAARCTVTSGGDVHCTNNSSIQWYWCGIVYTPRPVHWQVPEGTPPSGGWPVVYVYEGTSPNYENDFESPFWRSYLDVYGDLFGLVNEAYSVREFLDDVNGTGRKYAVIAPAPPQSTLFLQFWHTNVIFPYSVSCDYSFFNKFFPQVNAGTYGAVNNNMRFAFGVSSGGYNTSRMAITFNNIGVWKALAVVSASYADCSGAVCANPCNGTATIPEFHPPTKFYHGTADLIVPIFTMRCYYDLLISKGKIAAKMENSGGHGYPTDIRGSNGIMAWFNANYNFNAVSASSYMGVDEVLTKGQYKTSSNGVYKFIYQTDGNVVLYHGSSAIWASGTNGKASTSLKMQNDGNLVLYNGTSAVWSSGTSGNGKSVLLVQSDGNTVIYTQGSGGAMWSTKTNGK
jgi:hypothetical protein